MKNKIRSIYQFVFLGLVLYVALRPLFDKAYASDFEAYCPFGGISSLLSKLSQGTMSCNMSEVQLLLGLGLLLGVLLVGKLFCSYVCPIGTVTEWLGKLGDKLKIRRDMPAVIDRPLRILKYVLFFITVYMTMTTSELFCKEFDPYFASVNLFSNSDITLYFAIPAFALTILGAIVFRMFWCRYLCPLNAISNVFMNVIGAGAVIIIFTIARVAGLHISYVYLLAGLTLVGIVTELGFMRSFFSPLPKITRNSDKCSECGLCDKKCPQGIKISQFEKVNHIDCTLCTDCVYNCPLKQTLSVNKKGNYKYLAPIAVVVLIALSLGAASKFELTTIAERWGKFNEIKNIAMYEQTGLKNVKCYGSSMSLKGKLENVEGIYGLDTYARSHTVKVYYNPAEISETKVKAALFTPTKLEVQKLKGNNVDSLAVWEVGIIGMFDLIDFNNLFYTLQKDKGVYGFETHFGEPVSTIIYYDANVTNPQNIKQRIETKKMTVEKAKAVQEIEFDFKVEGTGVNKGFISAADYRQRIFRPYDRMFNDYKEYKPEELSVFIFPMPEAANSALRRFFGSLSSHLSADSGIVRLSTRYFKTPCGLVYYDPQVTSVENIKAALVKPQLTIFLSDTETKDIKNPFHIKPDNGYEKPAVEMRYIDNESE